MRVLITSFVFLFASVEFYQWIGDFTWSLPILTLGGALLAIASNYGKSPGWYFRQHLGQFKHKGEGTPIVNPATPIPNYPNLNSAGAPPLTQPPRSISFTIRPTSQGEVPNQGSSIFTND